MKTKKSLLVLVCLVAAISAHAQNTIAVSASHIQGLNGTLLSSGSLCFQGTDQHNTVISFQQGGGGPVVSTPFCTSITAGAISTFNVPNPANTSPVNIRYHITVVQGSRTIANFPGAYLCNATAACTTPYTFNFDNCLSSGACIANPIPITSGPAGPAGPPGLPCVGSIAAYNAGTTYALDNCVSSSGIVYISLINGNIGNSPPTSPTDWASSSGPGGGTPGGSPGQLQYNNAGAFGGGDLSGDATTSGSRVVSIPNCNATTRGFVPTPPNSASLYLDGTCNFTAPGGLGALTIFATGFGVTANGNACYGLSSTIVITSASATVTCNTASFTNADVGKYIFGTDGCCGTQQGYLGVLKIKGTISSVTNSTTAVVSATATGSCTGTNCILIWGTLDDTNLSAAETAWRATQACGALQLPSGMILVAKGHFDTASTGNCASVTFSQSYGGTVSGTGPGSTLIVPTPDFDFSTCPLDPIAGTTHTCFFNYLTPVVQNLGFFGGGYGNTGTHSNTALIGLYQGAQAYQLTASGFGGSDTALQGIKMVNGARAIFTTADGFGFQNFVSSTSVINAFNYCYWCFGADSAGNALHVSGGNFFDYGSQWGPTGTSGSLSTANSIVLLDQNNGAYYGYGSGNFVLGSAQKSPTNNTALYVSTGAVAYLYGTIWDNNSDCVATCQGLVISTTAKVYSYGSIFKGSNAGIDNAGGFSGASGGFWDMGGNTATPYIGFPAANGVIYGSASVTGTQFSTSSFALTSGWGSSTKASGGGDSHDFNFVVTGAAGSAGPVVTITFPTAFWIAPASCSVWQTSGTYGVLTNPAIGSLATTGFTITFAGTPGANTYGFSGHCGP